MADPFSIIAGTAGLADVCIRLGKLLKDAREDFQNTDHELSKLEARISAVKGTIEQVGKLYHASVQRLETVDQQAESSHWRTTGVNLEGCRKVIDQLERLITAVVGEKTTHPKTYQFRKYLRLLSKEKDFALLQDELQSYNGFLQTNLTSTALLVSALGIICLVDRLIYSSLYTTDLASQRSVLNDLQTEIKLLREINESRLGQLVRFPRISTHAMLTHMERDSTVASAENVLSIRSLNEHFDPPRAVSSMFTGRSEELDKLKQAVLEKSTNASPEQKRFVVYGPPGSGKTEFCCKFASENKHR